MTPDEPLIVDEMRWTLSPSGRTVLGAQDLLLQAHLDGGRARVVKDGAHRAVYAVRLPRSDVYWKQCRLDGSRAWWREVLRGPKARLEFNRATELARRGIATIEPLAWGQHIGRWPRGSCLLTRALAGAVPLDTYLESHAPAQASERRVLAHALGRFIDRLHAAGVTHPDLHPGNLLIRPDAGGPAFFLIDVHDVQIGKPLSRAARLANLTLLNRWFNLRANRTDRLRFFRAYAGREFVPDDAVEIEQRTQRSALQLWSSRSGRCRRSNRDFQVIGAVGIHGMACRSVASTSIVEFLSAPDEPFSRAGIALLKDSRSATVCRLSIPASAGEKEVVYKRLRVTKWSDPIVDLVRPHAALRSWSNGHGLLDRGLPTPRPLLMILRRRWGFTREGYLLFEFVRNARHLHEAVHAASSTQRLQIIANLARLIRLLHDRGGCQRDLKAANILVGDDGNCHLIDLVGMRFRRIVTRQLRVRDLSRLNASFLHAKTISRTDRLRFLRTYMLWSLRGSAGWRKWWNEINEATLAKERRNIRNNRPLT